GGEDHRARPGTGPGEPGLLLPELLGVRRPGRPQAPQGPHLDLAGLWVRRGPGLQRRHQHHGRRRTGGDPKRLWTRCQTPARWSNRGRSRNPPSCTGRRMNTGHVQGRNPHPSGWGGGQLLWKKMDQRRAIAREVGLTPMPRRKDDLIAALGEHPRFAEVYGGPRHPDRWPAYFNGATMVLRADEGPARVIVDALKQAVER